MSLISENLEYLRNEIDKACRESHRDPDQVMLIAVTKTAGISEAAELVRLGVEDLGENRARDILDKAGQVDDRVRWHFIGHLQTNKAKVVTGLAEWIHSIDSLRLVEVIDKAAGAIKKRQKVLLEVNISGEPGKFGLQAEEVPGILDKYRQWPNIEIRGFMTMAPLGDREQASSIFLELQELAIAERSKSRPGLNLDQLSMGMSNDFREAIMAGATMVRIGTAIFEDRRL